MIGVVTFTSVFDIFTFDNLPRKRNAGEFESIDSISVLLTDMLNRLVEQKSDLFVFLSDDIPDIKL